MKAFEVIGYVMGPEAYCLDCVQAPAGVDLDDPVACGEHEIHPIFADSEDFHLCADCGDPFGSEVVDDEDDDGWTAVVRKPFEVNLGGGRVWVGGYRRGGQGVLMFSEGAPGTLWAEGVPRTAPDDSTLGLLTFDNVASVDVVVHQLQVLREKMVAHAAKKEE